MPSPLRFKDANLRLQDFEDYLLVECPQCHKRAEVRKMEAPHSGARISCRECHFQSQDTLIRYDISLSTYCNSCGHSLKLVKLMQKEPIAEITIVCPKCKTTEDYQPKIIRLDLSNVVNKGCCDPYFGCELWLQSAFKSDVFWATNYQHLSYLKEYIQSGLRERNNREFFTMVEKLPSFVKSAKNRIKLLKIIHKLEQK